MKELGKLRKEVHVVFREADGMWHITLLPETAADFSLEFDTQEEADEIGKIVARARKCEYVLHAKDGTIREKNSYGKDPKNIPG